MGYSGGSIGLYRGSLGLYPVDIVKQPYPPYHSPNTIASSFCLQLLDTSSLLFQPERPTHPLQLVQLWEPRE